MLISGFLSSVLIGLFAATPSSTNYNLKTYDLGNGGGTSSSTNYNLNAITNGQGGSGTSTNYKADSGLLPTQNANVPVAANFTNPDTSYNRLKLVINTSNNASDAKYAIAISSDNFVTTQYVKNDNSIGNSLTLADYQTYSAWGGAGGIWVTGLVSNTTYKVKIKAMQGKLTETGYGPTAQATTDQPSITFSVATSLSGSPPFDVAFNSLTPNTVIAANADPLIGLTTNAMFGGKVYIYDVNSGLKSNESSYTINSVTTDLATASMGYGAQVVATGQTSGGPITSVSPYDSGTDNVGFISNLPQPILSTAGPVNTGTATIRLKAKSDATVPSSSDYGDTITFVAAMLF